MNKEQAIKNIKDTLKSLMKFESDIVENKFAEVVTNDGQKLSFNGTDLATDVEIFNVDENGNQTPLEDGTYILQDGRTIVVTSGKVSEISEAVVVEDGGETPVEDANVQMDMVPGEGMEPVVQTEVGVEQPEEEEVNPLEIRISELEAKVVKCMEMLSALTNVSEEMSQKFEEFSNQPAAEVVNVKKFERELTKEELRIERLRQMSKSI